MEDAFRSIRLINAEHADTLPSVFSSYSPFHINIIQSSCLVESFHSSRSLEKRVRAACHSLTLPTPAAENRARTLTACLAPFLLREQVARTLPAQHMGLSAAVFLREAFPSGHHGLRDNYHLITMYNALRSTLNILYAILPCLIAFKSLSTKRNVPSVNPFRL